ncbi:MAG TPA: hypothetical protein VLZ81_12070 [Blastocatellia bacterium]|nr:hypothetical protein [Blastocatellia bacterium]
MKECPVCKESFGDEMSFCDIDGTPLDAGDQAPEHGGGSRLWSVLGIVALLGAVVISAVAIIFFPRGFSPAVNASRTQTAENSPAASRANGPSVLSPSASGDDAPGATLDASLDNSNTAKLDRNANADAAAKLAARRAQLLKNQNGDPSLPNPKTVFEPEPASAKAVDTGGDQDRPRVTKPVEPVDPDAQGKTAAKSPDTADKTDLLAGSGKNGKKKTSKSPASSDSSNANKKKGGFLKMFKKIFG